MQQQYAYATFQSGGNNQSVRGARRSSSRLNRESSGFTSGVTGSGPSRPVGVSPSVTGQLIGGETIYAGHRWPPPGAAWIGNVSKRAGYEAPAAAGVFRKGIWGLPYFSDIVLADFVDYAPPPVPPVVNPPPDYVWKNALDILAGSPDQ